MEKQMAKIRIHRACRHNVPTAADVTHQVGDEVLVFREKIVNNHIGEWLGPFIVKGIYNDRKLIYVANNDTDSPSAFRYTLVKKYLRPSEAATAFFEYLKSVMTHFTETVEDDDDGHNLIEETFLTESINKEDPQANNSEMTKANKAELLGLIERGIFKLVAQEDISADANVLPGRFVLTITKRMTKSCTRQGL